MSTLATAACRASRGRIDAHFGGRIDPEEERTLRVHLTGCADCRSYYDRHLMLAALDPSAKSAAERIAVGLGFSVGAGGTGEEAAVRAPFRLSGSRIAPLAWAACAAAVVLLLLVPARNRHEGEFAARGVGTAASEPHLLVYRIHPHEQLPHTGGVIKSGDDLAFAYSNPANYRHLSVFGVDEHRHVYWYYPAWLNEEENPLSIDVAPGAEVRELPEAISHALDGRRLTIVAVFSNDVTSVRNVEELVTKNAAVDEPLGLRGAYEERLELGVER
jgi:hypothetical protein